MRDSMTALPALRGLAWGVATVLAGGLLGYVLLVRSVGPRLTVGGTIAAMPVRSLRGLIELDASRTGHVAPASVVFLSLRRPGDAAGPPLAVQRIPAASFPLRFEVGARDSMLGQPLPPSVALDARLDLDGDADTRVADEPSAHLDAAEPGGTDVRLVLR